MIRKAAYRSLKRPPYNSAKYRQPPLYDGQPPWDPENELDLQVKLLFDVGIAHKDERSDLKVVFLDG